MFDKFDVTRQRRNPTRRPVTSVPAVRAANEALSARWIAARFAVGVIATVAGLLLLAGGGSSMSRSVAQAAPAPSLSLAACPGAAVSFPLESGSIQWLFQDPDSVPKFGHNHTGIDVWPSSQGQSVGAPITGTFQRKDVGVHLVNDSGTLDIYLTHVVFDSWVADGVRVERGQKIGTVNSSDGHVHMSMSTTHVGSFNDLLLAQAVDPSPHIGANVNIENGALKSSKPLLDWCGSTPPPTSGAGYRAHWVQAPANDSFVLTGPIRLSAAIDFEPTPIGRVEFTFWTPSMGPWSGPWGIACSDSFPSFSGLYECDFYPPFGNLSLGEMNVSFDIYSNSGSRTLSPGWIRRFYYAGLGYPASGGGTAPSPGLASTLEDVDSADRISIRLGDEMANLGTLDNRVSRVVVPSGEGVGELVCYTELDFSGTPYRYGPGRTYNLAGFENNALSSCRFERAGQATRPTVGFTSTAAQCVGPGAHQISWSGTNATEFSYHLNDQPWSAWSQAMATGIDSGATRSNRFELKARGPGGESDPIAYNYESDITPPELTVTQTGGVAGPRPPWFKKGTTAVTTSAVATDIGCGSPGLSMQVSRDGGNAVAYSGAIVISAEGKWQIEFTARDGVGNSRVVTNPVWIDRQNPRPGIKLTYKKTATDNGTIIEVFNEITCSDVNNVNAATPVSGCLQWWYGTSQGGPMTLYTGPILVERVTLPKCSSWSKSYSANPWMKAEDVAGNIRSVMTAFTSISVSHNDSLNCGTPTPAPQASCRITANATSMTLSGGSSMTLTIKVYSSGGFNGPVTLTTSGGPIGITATLQATTVTPSLTGTSVGLTLRASNPPGGQSSTLVISGTSGNVSCTPASISLRT